MPFKVGYHDRVPIAFHDLPGMEQVMFRKLVGSFPHDRWLQGRPVDGAASPGTELLELSNGTIRLVYELSRAEESVYITNMFRD